MNFSQPLPSDVYEADIPLLGVGFPPSTALETSEFPAITGGGVTWLPRDPWLRTDATGSATLTVVATVAGAAGDVPVGTVFTIGNPPGFATTAPARISTFGAFARHLALLLGPAYQPTDASRVARDMTALGGALALGRLTNKAAADEAFGDSADQLLSVLETSYGLQPRPDLSTADRRVRLVAKIRAARAGTPLSIRSMVRAIDGAATIEENTPSLVPREADKVGPPAVWGAQRLVFQWGVRIAAATYGDANKLAQLRALLAQMKPAHTRVSIHTNDTNLGFRFDDPDSLFDRDVFGS